MEEAGSTSRLEGGDITVSEKYIMRAASIDRVAGALRNRRHHLHLLDIFQPTIHEVAACYIRCISSKHCHESNQLRLVSTSGATPSASLVQPDRSVTLIVDTFMPRLMRPAINGDATKRHRLHQRSLDSGTCS